MLTSGACLVDYSTTGMKLGEEKPETALVPGEDPLTGTESGALKSRCLESSCGRSGILPERLGVGSGRVFWPQAPGNGFREMTELLSSLTASK